MPATSPRNNTHVLVNWESYVQGQKKKKHPKPLRQSWLLPTLTTGNAGQNNHYGQAAGSLAAACTGPLYGHNHGLGPLKMRDSLSAESNFNRIMIAGGRAPESGLPASKSVHGQASGPGLIITSQPESDSGPEVHLFFLAQRACSSQPSGADWAVIVINHEFSSVCASASLDVACRA